MAERVGRIWRVCVIVGMLLVYGAAPAAASTEAPIEVVDRFLAARNAGDYSAAAGWCAALLELQDIDGSWFVDTGTTSDWLRQLSEKYEIDMLATPTAEGAVVTWIERLTRRDLPASNLSVEVHAVVREGKIAYLSAPYPPIAFLRPAPAVDATVTDTSTGMSPGVLFVGSALVLLVAVLGFEVALKLART
jgi:hypothetical protein